MTKMRGYQLGAHLSVREGLRARASDMPNPMIARQRLRSLPRLFCTPIPGDLTEAVALARQSTAAGGGALITASRSSRSRPCRARSQAPGGLGPRGRATGIALRHGDNDRFRMFLGLPIYARLHDASAAPRAVQPGPRAEPGRSLGVVLRVELYAVLGDRTAGSIP